MDLALNKLQWLICHKKQTNLNKIKLYFSGNSISNRSRLYFSSTDVFGRNVDFSVVHSAISKIAVILSSVSLVGNHFRRRRALNSKSGTGIFKVYVVFNLVFWWPEAVLLFFPLLDNIGSAVNSLKEQQFHEKLILPQNIRGDRCTAKILNCHR